MANAHTGLGGWHLGHGPKYPLCRFAKCLAIFATLLKISLTHGQPAGAVPLPGVTLLWLSHQGDGPIETRTKAEQSGLTELSSLPGSGERSPVCVREADGPHEVIALVLSCQGK